MVVRWIQSFSHVSSPPHHPEACINVMSSCLTWNSQQCFLNNATLGIILGTHREKGAFTFWSYALGFPLASSSILSWKFCHVLHKVLRDGHRNVRPINTFFLPAYCYPWHQWDVWSAAFESLRWDKTSRQASGIRCTVVFDLTILDNNTFSQKTGVCSEQTERTGFVWCVSFLLKLSPWQVLQDCMRHHSSLVEIGKLWVSLDKSLKSYFQITLTRY